MKHVYSPFRYLYFYEVSMLSAYNGPRMLEEMPYPVMMRILRDTASWYKVRRIEYHHLELE